MKISFVAALFLLLTAGSCDLLDSFSKIEKDIKYPEYNPVEMTDLVVTPMDGEAWSETVSFDQGWDKETSEAFWFTSQGSRVIPYTWFTWLEQPGNTQLFRNSEHMDMLGYHPQEASKMNPSGLPIGFAITESETMEKAFVGLTCAACHTNKIEHEGKNFMIDGAPTLGNFVLFFDRLVASLESTHQDDEKFARFSEKVLGESYSAEDAKQLREQLLEVAKGSAERKEVNKLPEHYASDFTSFGRLDAFTNIMNAGTAFGLGMLENKNFPIAPVSYPFLWGTHQSDFVQWNGSAPNIPRSVGPMIRNAGEVVGVFGGLTIKEKPDHEGKFNYEGTVNFPSLGKLEGFVKNLKSPQWDDPNSNLPPVDMDKVAEGAILYKENCARCHQVIDSNDQLQNYRASLIPVSEVGTDPVASWAAQHHMASSGMLEGTKAEIVVGDTLKATVRAITIPVNGVVGLALRSPFKVLAGSIITSKEGEKTHQEHLNEHIIRRDSLHEARHQQAGHEHWDIAQNTPTKLDLDGLVYKARPLNGIWATAPYLHNGSVPNLWELLKAPKDRTPEFWVGSAEFDAINVGFVSNRGKNNFKVYKGQGANRTIIPGNSNLGHDYAGGQYTDDQKWALIEYMKTL
jgi:hypothetical protein